MNKFNRRQYIKSNDHDWYVVKTTDNRISLQHQTELSSILECGHSIEEYDIKSIQQCGSGEWVRGAA